MTDDEKKFDAFMRSQGWGEVLSFGPLGETVTEWEMALGQIKGFISGLVTQNLRKVFDNIPIVEINNISDVNAFAAYDIENNQHYISLNFGLLQALKFVFHYLMSDPEFLPEVGNNILETTPTIKLKNLEIASYKTIEKILGCREIPSPNCDIRHRFADELLYMAIQFIGIHELMHILEGHVDFYEKKFNSTLNEFTQLNEDEQENLILHCFEVHSDFGAILNLSRSSTDSLRTNVHDLIKPYFENKSDSFRYTLIAVFVFFKIAEGDDVDLDEILKYDHPPAKFRQYFITDTVLVLGEFQAAELTEMRLSMHNSIAIVQNGLIKLVENGVRPFIDDKSLELYKSHYKKLQDMTNELMESIDDFRYL